MLSKPGMFEAPSAASVPPLDDYIQPTLNHGLRVWWAYYWPTLLIFWLIGYALNRLYGPILRNYGAMTPWVYVTKGLALAVAFVLVSFFVFQYVLTKKFRHFQIVIVGDNTAQLPVTLKRALTVWWSFYWRSLLFMLLVTLVFFLPSVVLVAILWPKAGLAVIALRFFWAAMGGAVTLLVVWLKTLRARYNGFRL